MAKRRPNETATAALKAAQTATQPSEVLAIIDDGLVPMLVMHRTIYRWEPSVAKPVAKQNPYVNWRLELQQKPKPLPPCAAENFIAQVAAHVRRGHKAAVAAWRKHHQGWITRAFCLALGMTPKQRVGFLQHALAKATGGRMTSQSVVALNEAVWRAAIFRPLPKRCQRFMDVVGHLTRHRRGELLHNMAVDVLGRRVTGAASATPQVYDVVARWVGDAMTLLQRACWKVGVAWPFTLARTHLELPLVRALLQQLGHAEAPASFAPVTGAEATALLREAGAEFVKHVLDKPWERRSMSGGGSWSYKDVASHDEDKRRYMAADVFLMHLCFVVHVGLVQPPALGDGFVAPSRWGGNQPATQPPTVAGTIRHVAGWWEHITEEVMTLYERRCDPGWCRRCDEARATFEQHQRRHVSVWHQSVAASSAAQKAAEDAEAAAASVLGSPHEKRTVPVDMVALYCRTGTEPTTHWVPRHMADDPDLGAELQQAWVRTQAAYRAKMQQYARERQARKEGHAAEDEAKAKVVCDKMTRNSAHMAIAARASGLISEREGKILHWSAMHTAEAVVRGMSAHERKAKTLDRVSAKRKLGKLGETLGAECGRKTLEKLFAFAEESRCKCGCLRGTEVGKKRPRQQAFVLQEERAARAAAQRDMATVMGVIHRDNAAGGR